MSWDKADFSFFSGSKTIFVPLTLGILYFNELETGTVFYYHPLVQSITLYLDGKIIKEMSLQSKFDYSEFMKDVDQRISKSKIIIYCHPKCEKTSSRDFIKRFKENLIFSEDENVALIGIYRKLKLSRNYINQLPSSQIIKKKT